MHYTYIKVVYLAFFGYLCSNKFSHHQFYRAIYSHKTCSPKFIHILNFPFISVKRLIRFLCQVPSLIFNHNSAVLIWETLLHGLQSGGKCGRLSPGTLVTLLNQYPLKIIFLIINSTGRHHRQLWVLLPNHLPGPPGWHACSPCVSIIVKEMSQPLNFKA